MNYIKCLKCGSNLITDITTTELIEDHFNELIEEKKSLLERRAKSKSREYSMKLNSLIKSIDIEITNSNKYKGIIKRVKHIERHKSFERLFIEEIKNILDEESYKKIIKKINIELNKKDKELEKEKNILYGYEQEIQSKKNDPTCFKAINKK